MDYDCILLQKELIHIIRNIFRKNLFSKCYFHYHINNDITQYNEHKFTKGQLGPMVGVGWRYCWKRKTIYTLKRFFFFFFWPINIILRKV